MTEKIVEWVTSKYGAVAESSLLSENAAVKAVAEAFGMVAYVGCIAGAIKMDDYRGRLLAAGFEHVEIVDSGADLNAYTKIENQAKCCSPSMDTASGLAVLSEPCCSMKSFNNLQQDLAALLSDYDVNSAAASVKVYAVKPVRTSPTACCGPTCCAPTAAL